MKNNNGTSLFDFKYFFWIFLITLGFIFGSGFMFQKIIALNQEIQELKNELRQAVDEKSSLNNQLGTTQNLYNQSQNENAALKNNLTSVTNGLSVCQVEKDQALTDRANLVENIGLLNQKISEIQAERDAAVSLISKLQSEVYRLYQERDYYRVAYTDAARKIAEPASQKPDEHENTPAIIRLLEAVFAKLRSSLFPQALGITITGAMSTTGLSVILRKLYLTRSRATRH